MKLKIVVLSGGKSPERKVSLISGAEVSKQLQLNGHQVIEIDPLDYEYGHDLIHAIHHHQPDVVFIALHGGDGENGVLQAMLAGSNLPFTGSDCKTSAVAMDKLLSKILAIHENIPVPAFLVLDKSLNPDCKSTSFEYCLEQLHLSQKEGVLVVKPNDAGSSVGVNIVSDTAKWQEAMDDSFLHSEKVLIEEYITGRELTVTMLDGEALPVVEIIPHNGFYDYNNKYSEGNTTYQAPADITLEETKRIQEFAVKMWQAMDCNGYGRIDFRYDGVKFYFLEVNTLPGMTQLSLTPMAAKAVGISFGELLDKIIRSVPQLKNLKQIQ